MEEINQLAPVIDQLLTIKTLLTLAQSVLLLTGLGIMALAVAVAVDRIRYGEKFPTNVVICSAVVTAIFVALSLAVSPGRLDKNAIQPLIELYGADSVTMYHSRRLLEQEVPCSSAHIDSLIEAAGKSHEDSLVPLQNLPVPEGAAIQPLNETEE